MCWDCEHLDIGPTDFLDHMRTLIGEHGWAIQGVEADRIRPPWAYTVGLSERGEPELVVTGLPLQRAASLLNIAATHFLPGAPPTPGEQFQLAGGPLLEVVELTEPNAHLYSAVDLYGPDIRALQLVHADKRGHWPWETSFRSGRGGQPVLGIRSR